MNAPTTPAMPVPPFATMFSKPEEVGDPNSILLYGPPGTWKTTIAGSIAKTDRFKDKRILYIDIDQGSDVFVNEPEVYAKVLDGSLSIVKIDKLDPQAFMMLRYFLGGDDENGTFIKGTDTLGVAFDPQWGYDVVVLDSLDVAQEVAVEWFLANTFSEKNPTQKNTQAAWGEISKWTSDMAWALQNHPTILGILVMHSKEGTEDNGKFSIKPKLSGSVKDNIAGIPDLVVYLGFEANDKKEVRVVATLGKSDITVTKNRWRLPDKLENFDLPLFYSLIDDRKASTKQAIGQTTPQAVAPAFTPAAAAA